LNKADLVERAASAAGITKAQAGTAIDACIDAVTGALKKGDRVTLVGLGTYSTSARKARTGRNPQTGKPIKIPAKRVVKFTAGADLKKSVNKK
jgi:DNA-binding protein HU-beta